MNPLSLLSHIMTDLAGIRGKINVFQFERDSLNRAGVKDSGTATPPFLVIASNDINEDLNAGMVYPPFAANYFTKASAL